MTCYNAIAGIRLLFKDQKWDQHLLNPISQLKAQWAPDVSSSTVLIDKELLRLYAIVIMF